MSRSGGEGNRARLARGLAVVKPGSCYIGSSTSNPSASANLGAASTTPGETEDRNDAQSHALAASLSGFSSDTVLAEAPRRRFKRRYHSDVERLSAQWNVA